MTTLLELLNLGLMDIGSDDSRFNKMEEASSDLIGILEEKPALIIPATLIAIDSDVDEKEPFFDIDLKGLSLVHF